MADRERLQAVERAMEAGRRALAFLAAYEGGLQTETCSVPLPLPTRTRPAVKEALARFSAAAEALGVCHPTPLVLEPSTSRAVQLLSAQLLQLEAELRFGQ